MPERLTDDELRQLAADHIPLEPPPCPVCNSTRVPEIGTSERFVCPLAPRFEGVLSADGNAHFTLGRWWAKSTDPRVLAAVIELLERRAAGEQPRCLRFAVREPPAVSERVETGAIAFAGDWPGLFVRGDQCIALRCALHVLRRHLAAGLDPTMLGPLLALEEIIANDVLGGATDPKREVEDARTTY
jgi:hypothetical protein